MTVDCYVINLDGETERWSQMAARLGELGVEPIRVAAVDGRGLPPQVIARHRRAGTTPLSEAEVGCLHSHMRAWALIVASQAPFGLVLEDDVHISPHLADLLAALQLSEGALAVWRLEATPMGIDVEAKPSFAFGRYRLHRLLSLNSCCGAYVVNKATAAKLLLALADSVVPVDLAMFAPEASRGMGVEIYQALPAPFVQDKYAPESHKLHIASIIGDRLTEMDRRPGLAHLLRPASRALRTVLGSFSGAMRTEAKFF